MIPEWEKMAGVLLNWPTLFPPLWAMFSQMMKSLDHVTTFLRIPDVEWTRTIHIGGDEL